MFRKKEKSQKEIQKLINIYQKATDEITDEMAMDMLGTEKRNDYLMLLNIAESCTHGKITGNTDRFQIRIFKRADKVWAV